MKDQPERRVIYFASGETMEEEEEEEEEEDQTFREPSERTWTSWRKTGILMMRMSLHACDLVGGRMAVVLGLDAAKYQYAVDEYHRNRPTSEDLSEAKGERSLLSRRLHRPYSATVTRTQRDSDQGSHNEAYQHDENH